MSTYCVAVRIADRTIGGKTYDDRRKAVEDAIYREGEGYWPEMTSFYLVTSDLSTSDFAKKASAGLSKADDLLIAFDPSDMSVGYAGPFEREDVLKWFFKHSRRV